MMRIPSGSTDRKIGFVAVDSTDFVTRETGLTTFTVYRSVEGAAATAYTTPTVAEISASNMPGCYVLSLDEALTLAAGHDTEQVLLHITQAAMAPVSLAFELYRPKATEGQTVTASGGNANAAVQTMATDALTAAAVQAAAGSKLADIFLRRTLANARASANGDAIANGRSLLGAAAKLVNKWSISGSVLTVCQEDDTTTFFTQTVVGTAGADPITSLDTV